MSESSGQGTGGAGVRDQVQQAAQRVMQSDTAKNLQDQARQALTTVQERYQAQGPELVERVKALAADAGVRKVSIQQDGKTILEFPLAAGAVGAVVGVLMMPQLVALGAIAALFTHVQIVIEREESGDGSSGSSSSGGSGSGRSG